MPEGPWPVTGLEAVWPALLGPQSAQPLPRAPAFVRRALAVGTSWLVGMQSWRAARAHGRRGLPGPRSLASHRTAGSGTAPSATPNGLGAAPMHATDAPTAPRLWIPDYTEARTRTPVSADPDLPKPWVWASSAAVARSAVPGCHWCRGASLPNMRGALGVLTIHPRIAACPPRGGGGSVRFLSPEPSFFARPWAPEPRLG